MNTIEFKEVQRFTVWWAWVAVAALNIVFIYAIVHQVFLDQPFGNKPAPDFVLILVQFMLLCFLVFLSVIKLKTRFTDNGIYYRFYPFHFKEKLIEWHELRDAYMRSYDSLYEFGGWGIRQGSKKTGRALNTRSSSNIGLQLQFSDGKLLLIGTAKPEELQLIINSVFAAGKINRRV